jgi:K(+)-stimulated pyrophosphate-energized sodium pump
VTTGAHRAVRVHQGGHPARRDDQSLRVGQQEGGGDLHTIRAEGDVYQHLPDGKPFFRDVAFAFFEPYFFIGYLISLALFGLYQAIFMANAGGAWDNAKKIVETELKQKGTPLHDATVVGDTVGDPFKDTSSVAMNPIIKFTTLFGLLAVELAVSLTAERGSTLSLVLSGAFLVIALVFVWRSFYAMRIEHSVKSEAAPARVQVR